MKNNCGVLLFEFVSLVLHLKGVCRVERFAIFMFWRENMEVKALLPLKKNLVENHFITIKILIETEH
jgi:hypothetical protein